MLVTENASNGAGSDLCNSNNEMFLYCLFFRYTLSFRNPFVSFVVYPCRSQTTGRQRTSTLSVTVNFANIFLIKCFLNHDTVRMVVVFSFSVFFPPRTKVYLYYNAVFPTYPTEETLRALSGLQPELQPSAKASEAKRARFESRFE